MPKKRYGSLKMGRYECVTRQDLVRDHIPMINASSETDDERVLHGEDGTRMDEEHE